jgi:GNAT superfamily N-acetyltransferase
MVTLRDATPADAAAMARIQSEALRTRGSEQYTDEQLSYLAPKPDATVIPDEEFEDDACRPVVAEREAVVGWGSVHLDPGVLAATFVDPEHAGQGIGRQIVEHLETLAREAGVETLTVHASLNAVGFYETLGFERRGEIDAGGPEAVEIPAVEMEKVLS